VTSNSNIQITSPSQKHAGRRTSGVTLPLANWRGRERIAIHTRVSMTGTR